MVESGSGFSHRSVMAEEVIRYLGCKAGGVYVDGTIGGGGHTLEILKATGPDGRVIGIDRDSEAVQAATGLLTSYGERVTVVRESFSEMGKVLASVGVDAVDGIVLDLGVSSHQLETPGRGFSFLSDAPLDMRMDVRQTLTAAAVIKDESQETLERIFRVYGEERYARRIARAVVRARGAGGITTTVELAEIVEKAIPRKKGARRARGEKIHPATRVFQALRIFVNDEIEVLKKALAGGVEQLVPGGRYVVISFHSLEDREVKNFFRESSKDCICPPSAPVCICNTVPSMKVLTRRVVKPSAEEVESNPRARSARLRAAEKL